MKPLEMIATTAVVMIAALLAFNTLNRPEPNTTVETATDYREGRSDTVFVRDTVYVPEVNIPVEQEEDGRLTIDTLFTVDSTATIHVWSRDIALEGLNIRASYAIQTVEIVRVDTLRIVETRTVEKRLKWYETREFGFVAGCAVTLGTVWAVRRVN
jgi:hypothetical protein